MKPSWLVLAGCLAATGNAGALIQVYMKTRESSNMGLIAELGELMRPHRFATVAWSAKITVAGVHCQFFKDPKGRDELGTPFTADNPITLTEEDEPVHIGSILCVRQGDQLVPPGQEPEWGDEEHDGPKEVRVQFRTGYNTFTNGAVALDELVALGSSSLGTTVVEAAVVGVRGVDLDAVKCQLYEDDKGETNLGDAFSAHSVTLGLKPVSAGSIRCKV